MAGLALILMGTGVVAWLVFGFFILATMDVAADWVALLLFFLWYVVGWGCLIVGAILGIIALFQVALA